MIPDVCKLNAARRALEFVKPGMRLGLGTGSTAAVFIDLLGAAVEAGLDVMCVPTSQATRARADALGIPLSTLDDFDELDLTVDGADELDVDLNLIKGGGGALLREKIVASSSARLVIIADRTKKVDSLGAFPLPVEVVGFGARATARKIAVAAAGVGCAGRIVERQRDGARAITDNGHVIYDCHFGVIADPPALARALCAVPGVVEHGLFIGLADVAVLGDGSGAELIKAGNGAV